MRNADQELNARFWRYFEASKRIRFNVRNIANRVFAVPPEQWADYDTMLSLQKQRGGWR
jgi:hypothetical protein